MAAKRLFRDFTEFGKLKNEFDEKVNGVKAEDYAGVAEKISWICPKGHSYQTTLANRLQGKGCPYCTGQKVLKGFNDLETTHPKVAREWDYEKNGELTPQMVTAGSNKKVWWKCSNGHSWQAIIANRALKGFGCPVEAGKMIVKGFNDLATTNPELANEWDYEKNAPLTPYMVTKASSKKVWWKCKNGHSYSASLNARTNMKSGCPECAGYKVEKGKTDLATLRPDIAMEWDTEKNKSLKPEDVTCYTHKKVWWKCSKCGKSWQASVANRTANNRGCPYCCIEKRKERG